MAWSPLKLRWQRHARHSDYSWITAQLAVGRALPSAVEAVRAGIGAVIDVRAEASPARLDEYRRAGLDVLWLPVQEHAEPTAGQLAEAARWTAPRFATGERVLVQCREGIGRSATFALAILVSGGLSPLEAYTRLKERRPAAAPSSHQLEAVLGFAQAAGGSLRTAGARATADEPGPEPVHTPQWDGG